ncbi:hypothetical protein PRODRIGUEZ_79 [Mycobacterium phage PRodriguez]|uniref:Uncharacterized protein n=1 Tax=Mycobacterium phage Acadian TaxID=2902794 RepID=G8I8B5_9CAUD|nr:hypothetical protein CM14_gp79 [Mycobacterium phage Acadian]AER48992.1 hypothetical protein ACADIAN_79 [Mycobacterium phage Acadian]WUT94849.1 hypothetical protein PRODRIGUEZ_79 [Mycobacterium phage PRodriguez]
MINVQPDMDVAKQRRKIVHRIVEAPDAGFERSPHVHYLEHLLVMFDAAVEAGRPRPASEFLPMYEEEFGL